MGGLGQIRMVTGAKIVGGEYNSKGEREAGGSVGVEFHLPQRSNGILRVVAAYERGRDLYRLWFFDQRFGGRLVSEEKGVFCDGLATTFEHVTGVFLTLYPIVFE